MSRYITLLLTTGLALFFAGSICADCPSDGIVDLLTQEDVDSFPNDCFEFAGTLRIGGTVSDLSPLAGLRSIGGYLEVEQTVDLDLMRFDSLELVGADIYIQNNRALETVDLPELISVQGAVWIFSNNFGSDICCLSTVSLPSLEYVELDLSLNSNVALEELELPSLQFVGELRVLYSPALEVIEAPQMIEGSLFVESNDVLERISVPNLMEAFRVLVRYNGSLSACCSLRRVLENVDPFYLRISQNAPGCNSPEEILQECRTVVEVPMLSAVALGIVFVLVAGVGVVILSRR